MKWEKKEERREKEDLRVLDNPTILITPPGVLGSKPLGTLSGLFSPPAVFLTNAKHRPSNHTLTSLKLRMNTNPPARKRTRSGALGRGCGVRSGMWKDVQAVGSALVASSRSRVAICSVASGDWVEAEVEEPEGPEGPEVLLVVVAMVVPTAVPEDKADMVAEGAEGAGAGAGAG
jgi:hypothetical protein